MLSFTMDQESFALDESRPNSTTNVFGIIQIQSKPLCFIPPVWTQVLLIGREEIASTSRIIVNDTYQLSSSPDDWCLMLSTNSSIDTTDNVYNLPFSLSVPNSLPASFQIQNQGPFICCGIYYTLEVRVSTMDQGVIQSIQFYRSNKNSNLIEGEECDIPKRVFWGITKQSKQRWQYELEFPNTFDLVNCKSGSVSVRLRSVSGQEMKGDCCLIGCQIIQSIHLEGYKSHIQVLATSTKLITNPNKTWKQSCQVDFDLNSSIFPTVDNQRLGVEHYVRITVEFCSTSGNSDCNMDLQFPVVFTGCALLSSQRKPESASVTRAVSISSCSSFGELSSHDSAIDIPSFKTISSYLHSYKLKI